MSKILLIDDDRDLQEGVSSLLHKLGYECNCAFKLSEGLKRAMSDEFDIVLLDVYLPDGNGMSAIQKFQNSPSSPQVIIITSHGDPEGAAQAVEAGAWDYLEKPISISTIKLVLHRAIRCRQTQRQFDDKRIINREKIIGSSQAIQKCLQALASVSDTQTNVLITGETGTGKELFAKTLHKNSSRAKQDFIVVDCASLPENLAESLLMGHQRGSFTGAYETRPGLIEQADQGTLFLDEVGELSFSVQKAFLRVLQEKSFRPLGSKKELTSDFRLIAATNRDLKKMVDNAEFRQDLYYRLSTYKMDLPSLRERREDIAELGGYFVEQICSDYGIQQKKMTEEYLEALKFYTWPGNVRELLNAVYSSVENAYSEPTLLPQHLPIEIRAEVIKYSVGIGKQDLGVSGCFNLEKISRAIFEEPGLPQFKQARKEAQIIFEKNYLNYLMQVADKDPKKACEISGLSRARLYELLKKHKIKLNN